MNVSAAGRRTRDVLVWILIALLSTVVAVVGVERIAMLGVMENWVTDFRMASVAPPEPQHPDIVIVSINEQTLERFPYRSPIDRRFLADLLGTLESKGVRGVMLDILLDQPTEATKDALLKKRLREMKIPVVVSYGVDHTGELLTRKQTAFLNDFLPPDLRGFANLVKDKLDGTVRRIYPGATLPDGGYLMGVSRALAAKLGVRTSSEQVRIAWRGSPANGQDPTFKTFPAHVIPLLPAAWLRDKIILIGVDLSLTDRHRTPFSMLLTGRKESKARGMPGIVVHAHSLAQLLDQRDFPDLTPRQRYLLVLGATVFGLLLAWFEINLYLSLIIELVGVLGYWLAGLILYKQQGVLLPLLAPSIASVGGFWLMQLYTGSEARRQKRMAEAEARIKAEMLANMSHEIRTPINAVIGMSELVLEMETEATKRKHLSTVISSAKSLLRLINDILDYSKMESGKMVMEEIVFDLRQSLEETLNTLTVPARTKGLALEMDVAADLPDCFIGDPNRLRQVVVNLVGNAIKFTTTGGVRVQVTAEPAESLEKMGLKTEQMLRFTVIDTGIGIAPDRLDAIFESYTQAEGSTARQHGGTGLGTTIAKQIVEQMSGRIWVESVLGEGSRFIFIVHLPVAEGVPQCRLDQERKVEVGGNRRCFNILLADDIEENVTLGRIRLEQRGHRVTTAADGLEALAASGKERFDVILMDVNMPNMGGFAATRAIRSREAKAGGGVHTLIIALTADAGQEDRELCLKAGMDEYATKPIDFEHLFELMERLVPEGMGEIIEERPPTEEGTVGAAPASPVAEAPETETVESAKPVLPPPFDRDLAGIDARKGLFAWGNPEAYQKSLAGFGRKHTDDMEEIRAALERDDVPAAKAVAHALKGVAGNLSALRLAESAGQLDAALRQRQGDPVGLDALRINLAQRNIDLDHLVRDVEGALTELVATCRELEPEKRTIAPARESKTVEILPAHHQLAQQLAEALDQGSATQAETCLKELEASGIVAEEELERLIELVDDFDFGEALDHLKKVAVSLGISLEVD